MKNESSSPLKNETRFQKMILGKKIQISKTAISITLKNQWIRTE